MMTVVEQNKGSREIFLEIEIRGIGASVDTGNYGSAAYRPQSIGEAGLTLLLDIHTLIDTLLGISQLVRGEHIQLGVHRICHTHDIVPDSRLESD